MVTTIINGILGTLTFVSTPQSSYMYGENQETNAAHGIWGFILLQQRTRFFFVYQKIFLLYKKKQC